MLKIKSRNRYLHISYVVAIWGALTACATRPLQTCDVPHVDHLIGVWDTVTPSNLSILDVRLMVFTNESAQNDGEAKTTNVHLGVPRSADCRCCVTLIFAENADKPRLIAALLARRFSSRREALTFANEAWRTFAAKDLSISEEQFLRIEDPYVARSELIQRADRAFIGDLRIEREADGQFIVRLHIAPVDDAEFK